MTEILAHGYSLRALSESYPMNTNMTGFKWLSNTCDLDESSLSNGSKKMHVNILLYKA